MPEKPLILVIDNSVAITGALKAIAASAASLQSQFRFGFVLPTGSAATPFLKNLGYPVFELPFLEISKRPKNLLLYFPRLVVNSYRLLQIANAQNAQIIHLNDFYNLTGIGAKVFGFKGGLVTHVRFMPFRFGALAKIWSQLNLRFSSQVICVSEAVRAFFPAGAPKVLVIPDPLPVIEKYPPVQRVGAANAAINLLYLANFISGKGQNFALEAFANAYRQNPMLRLSFIGGDMGLEKNRAYKQDLLKRTVELGLTEVVSFAAFSDDVEKDTKQADIALNFSESESFSLTCLEALYFGTPLIATDSGGPAELFEHGCSGLLVPNRDVAAMTQAILELASDPERRARFSAEGRAFVRTKFCSENTSEKLGSLYRQVLTRQPPK